MVCARHTCPYNQSSRITAFREGVQSPPFQFRATKLIISARVVTGDYNFVFEWARTPTHAEFEHLMAEIDDALRP
jgi:hypothetical protein